jgi:hypothetical protein
MSEYEMTNKNVYYKPEIDRTARVTWVTHHKAGPKSKYILCHAISGKDYDSGMSYINCARLKRTNKLSGKAVYE